MSLPSRPIAGRPVSAVSLGCMGLNHAYGNFPTEAESIRLLNRALDLGVTMLDTAALYADGRNEILLGKAVMHRRAEFLLASKCVLGMFDGARGLDGRPEAITATLDAALARLGTEHIDLYYLHRLDPNVPIEDSVGALVCAKQAGKIGAIGVSEMSATTLRRAHVVHPIAAIQNEYSPAARNVEMGLLSACRELGTAMVAFSPVMRGMLARAIRSADYATGDIRKSLPRFVEPQLAENLKLVDAYDRIADGAGITPAQLALGWVLAQGENVIALPGTTNIVHLEENVTTLAKPVPQDAIDAVSALFPRNAMKGARYTAVAQAQVDTELLPEEELA